jgi:hypothetical protein
MWNTTVCSSITSVRSNDAPDRLAIEGLDLADCLLCRSLTVLREGWHGDEKS